jgi:GxxExxY protein
MNEQGMQNCKRSETPLPPLDPGLEQLTYRVVGCGIEVHRALGPGFLESVYAESLAFALGDQGITFVREVRVGVVFKGRMVGIHRLDLLVDDQLVVELKAVERLAPVHFAQVRSYLRATHLRAGLLLNFEAATLEIRRILNPLAARG